MRFGSAVLCSVIVAASCTINSINAFTINPGQSSNKIITPTTARTTSDVSEKKSIILPSSSSLFLDNTPVTSLNHHQSLSPKSISSSSLLRMVAGGAERAYGDEYYEGKLLID